MVGYSVSGDATEDEYIQVASELRDDIARQGSIRILFRLSDVSFSSFFTGLDEHFRFVSEHQDDLERVAIVTDGAATGLLAKATEAMPGMDVQTFSSDDEPKAWAWLE